ncbi:RNA polymerase sigma factor sigma-70 region 4 domain-containing protein [Beduini massiliensis]|uniref:hypothetical protein n=1 Tax=Beduini massiliensis TaxID=1585974 RepID=UPI00059A8625|nr:hypothetical protein [Beduini massiliensis]
MTYDEKINYLKSFQYLKKECKDLKEQLELIEYKKSKINSGILHITINNSNAGHSPLHHLISETDFLQEQITLKLNEYNQTLKNVEQKIQQLDDIQEQQILRYRYIYGYTFQKIADKMHYNDKSYVHKCHKKIIQKLDF